MLQIKATKLQLRTAILQIGATTLQIRTATATEFTSKYAGREGDGDFIA